MRLKLNKPNEQRKKKKMYLHNFVPFFTKIANFKMETFINNN